MAYFLLSKTFHYLLCVPSAHQPIVPFSNFPCLCTGPLPHNEPLTAIAHFISTLAPFTSVTHFLHTKPNTRGSFLPQPACLLLPATLPAETHSLPPLFSLNPHFSYPSPSALIAHFCLGPISPQDFCDSNGGFLPQSVCLLLPTPTSEFPTLISSLLTAKHHISFPVSQHFAHILLSSSVSWTFPPTVTHFSLPSSHSQ